MMPVFGYILGGPMDLMIIGLVVLLLFGNRLPKAMRSLGTGLTEFKKGLAGVEDDHEQAGSARPKKVAASDELPKSKQPAAEAEVKKTEV
jgi:sec-independent protein translocase protein TatA